MAEWNGTERRQLGRHARQSITCLDELLKKETLTEFERTLCEALRGFMLEQWLPHLQWADSRMEEIETSREKLDLLIASHEKLYSALFTPLEGGNGTEEPFVQVLRRTVTRGNVWMDGACFFIRYVIPLTVMVFAALLWLIKNHKLLTL